MKLKINVVKKCKNTKFEFNTKQFNFETSILHFFLHFLDLFLALKVNFYNFFRYLSI